MLCDDGHAYVVKFQNNPQHIRVLTNEWLGSGIARGLGLPVPPSAIVDVPSSLIAATKELTVNRGTGTVETCQAGLQFGSRLVGGLLPGITVDYLPESYLLDVPNLSEFCGALVFDKWVTNSDGRQAVFSKESGKKCYKASFIDQGFCFNAGEWKLKDAPLLGVYARNLVYRDVTGWESFEPWLTRMEAFSIDSLWTIAAMIPPEWCGNDRTALEGLIEQLFKRRSEVRELIIQFRDSSRQPFPLWKCN